MNVIELDGLQVQLGGRVVLDGLTGESFSAARRSGSWDRTAPASPR